MSITFVPERGAILICDFARASVAPEMTKTRRVVVVSPKARNHRHGTGPGVALVIPLSTSAPNSVEACDVLLSAGIYRSVTKDAWAKCGAVTMVSHERLDRVRIYRAGKPAYIVEGLSPADMARIEAGLRHALGIA